MPNCLEWLHVQVLWGHALSCQGLTANSQKERSAGEGESEGKPGLDETRTQECTWRSKNTTPDYGLARLRGRRLDHEVGTRQPPSPTHSSLHSPHVLPSHLGFRTLLPIGKEPIASCTPNTEGSEGDRFGNSWCGFRLLGLMVSWERC